MRVNTAKSIQLGERIHDAYGNWDKAIKASQLRGDVYVLQGAAASKLTPKRDPKA